MVYYTALKGNKLSINEKIGRKVKCILLKEISQSEKATFRKKQNYGYSTKISGFQEFGEGGDGS